MDVVKLAVPPVFGSIPTTRTPIRRSLPVSESFEDYLSGKLPVSQSSRSPQASAVYEVKPGDTLWRICRDTLTAQGEKPDGAAIREAIGKVVVANRLRDADALRVGQRLQLSVLQNAPAPTRERAAVSLVPPLSPHVSRGLEWATPPAVQDSQVSSTTKVTHSDSVTARNSSRDISLAIQEILARRAASSEYKKNNATTQQSWEVLVKDSNSRITSGFGKRKDPFTGLPEHHAGVDISALTGTPIHPIKEGEVVFSGWKGTYGRLVVIRHDDGTETRYAHASKTLVKKGDRVTPETQIAQVGSSGRATGPHLHFEYHVDGKAVNPMSVLNSVNRLQVASRL